MIVSQLKPATCAVFSSDAPAPRPPPPSRRGARASASSDRQSVDRRAMLRHVLQAASTGRPLQDSVSAAVTLGGAFADMVAGLPDAPARRPNKIRLRGELCQLVARPLRW